MSVARYGDAKENGNETNLDDELYAEGRISRTRQATRHFHGPTSPHHGFVFKAFTRESLANILKRKTKKNSASNLDPAKLKPPQPDPYLASGQQLPPAFVRQLPAELVGKPIEDIDPYYSDQETFMIVSRGKELTRFSATKALCLLGPFHPIRRVVLYILVNPLFNLLVILTILINCILMTIQGSETVEKTEVIFTIVYTTEMGLKVLARGFIMDEFTYLRDPWNWLDFAVILMAYLTIVVQDLGNLSVMRTFRVLRALKTVAIIPGMKTIVGAVIDSVKNLKDVVVLTLFSLSVFSLLGLQIYMGQLTQKCILNGRSNMTDTEWHIWCSNSSHWVPEPDDEIFGAYRLCGNATGAQSCPADHTCIQGFGPNPDYGFTNFDTFGWALICSFRLMTQDFWEGLYMQVLKTAGSWHIIFFIVSIFLGSIYLMNLILAIVAMSYNELQRRAEEEEEAAAEDEAAFLESCRLMELQEQASDVGSYSTVAPSSYRPSVEIGLVGQSLLASLCQNGLLGQHVREKLNQQMMLSGTTCASYNNAVRSHSLSVAITAGCSNAGPSSTNRDNAAINKRGSVTSNYYQQHHHTHHHRQQELADSIAGASSMTELRRKSSSFRGGSPTYLPERRSPREQRHPFAGKLARHHHASSGVLMTPTRGGTNAGGGDSDCRAGGDQGSLICHSGLSRSARSSTTSDRDLYILRKRAALIRIGDTLGQKERCANSSDVSEESNTSIDKQFQDTNIERRQSDMKAFSTSSHVQHAADLLSRAHDHSYDQQQQQQQQQRRRRRQRQRHRQQQQQQHLQGDERDGDTNDHEHLSDSAHLGAQVGCFRSEVAICQQPLSIINQHAQPPFSPSSSPPTTTATIASGHRALAITSRMGAHLKRRSLLSDNSGSNGQSITSHKSCIEPPTQSLLVCQPTLSSGRALSHSNLLGQRQQQQQQLHPSSAFGHQLSLMPQQQQLQAGSKMHHLSVENFQQFGAMRPQPQHKSTASTDTSGGERDGTRGRSGSVRSQDSPAHSETSDVFHEVHQAHLNSTMAGHSLGGGRHGSRGHIHPSTMARSSFARPRPSVVMGGISGTTGDSQLPGAENRTPGARRMSQDFIRRASDWSRLSMSTNVDLRRLLRLWSHTNPYQGRPSIGSFSNYSQAPHQTSAHGSPGQSIRDEYYNQNNSPRPSSVGSSARQAYELISAFSRHNNQYQSDHRYAIPLDDSMMDRISVNMRDKCIAYCLSCLDILCIWECCGAWLRIQRVISIVVFDPFTELFIIFCILINTLFMALDSDDADAQMKSIFERGNYFFTATFAVEASMKIMALSPKFYFREGWNVFDSIIVGLSLLELGLEGVYGLSVLRSFRLLRVFKLAKSWPTLNLLISIMGKAVGDLGNLTFVLAIIVFIFAVMGMQLFGNKYVANNFPSGELPRWNFTDFMHSFMIVFRILCAEWIEPMWDCLLVGGWPCIPFFLIAVTVGNLVVLNLFLALLLASFGASNLSSPQSDNVDTKKLKEAIARFSRFGRWLRRKANGLFWWLASCFLQRDNKRRRTKKDGVGGASLSANNQNGSDRGNEQPVKSHIAAMSRLERLKNIELRTEELKSKIKRSPEQHYHLRQLAQFQLKESTQNLTIPVAGCNYNYNKHNHNHHHYHHSLSFRSAAGQKANSGDADDRKGDEGSIFIGQGGPMPMIPIIVNEASEGDEYSNSERRHSVIFDSTTMCISPAISQEISEFNENQASIAEIYQSSKLQQQQEQSITCEIQCQQYGAGSSNKQAPSRHYLVNMQPIEEDLHDADTSSPTSEMDQVKQGSLDQLAKDEISSMVASNRWKLIRTSKSITSHLSMSSRAEEELAQRERLIGLSSEQQVDADDKDSEAAELHCMPSDKTSQRPANKAGSHLTAIKETSPTASTQQLQVLPAAVADEDVHQEQNKPKSSLYLKAPKRQEMEEDDERALQHIETYIEKCICFGIICLKWFLFRQHVRKIVEHKYFDQCILVLIVISSGTLALEDKHLNERPTLKRTLDVLDTIFTIIFSLEMIFKWLAFGMKRYFGNIWSWLDFVIVLVSFVNLMASIFGSGKIQALKTMRTLRAMRGLRPLRALQRFQGMRVVVNALIQAIPSIFNVLLVCLIFWLIFSIMGVQMFGGKFWRCLHPETYKVVSFEEAASRHECIERNLTWANPQINFDNVLNAYLALFQVATFKGWIDIMNSATDSRTRDDQPIREANIYMYFYFVFFVIFGSFFTLNLFIGVIIDNFNEQKKKTGGSLEIFMTDDQKKYYHAMKKMRSKRPVKAMTRPKFKLQAYMFDITTSKKFDMAIMIIIGLNMFVMALEHYGQSQEFSMILENLNLIFIAVFTLECLCKIFAMRHFYFREPWNIFDFIVVDLSILGVVMKEYVAKYFVSPTLLRVVRVVKVGRVLRLVKGAKGIRTLLFALAMSLPALFNICLLLFLVMFIYAIFGMSFFMNVRPRAGIDETFNFDTFTSSIIVLFQMSTSAAWDMVLDPLMDEENDCQKPDPAQGIEGTCGNKGIAIFYLISYVIVTFLIIINMYIAVILENYSQATEDVQEGLTDDDYEMYYEIWQKFDPDGTQYLPYEKLSDFVDALEDPLRIPKPNNLALVVLDINIYAGNQCYCVDILDALTKYFFERKGLVIQVNEHLQQVQSTLHETPFERITTTYLLKRQHYCATVIQNCWRKWKAQIKRKGSTGSLTNNQNQIANDKSNTNN